MWRRSQVQETLDLEEQTGHRLAWGISFVPAEARQLWLIKETGGKRVSPPQECRHEPENWQAAFSGGGGYYHRSSEVAIGMSAAEQDQVRVEEVAVGEQRWDGRRRHLAGQACFPKAGERVFPS